MKDKEPKKKNGATTSKAKKKPAKNAGHLKREAKKREEKRKQKEAVQQEKERLEREKEMQEIREKWLNVLEQKEEWLELPIEKILYAAWLATPQMERETNQKGMSQLLDVSPQTLTAWSLDENVSSLRRALIKAYFQELTPEIIFTLGKAATTTDEYGRTQVPAAKLFLEYVEGFNGEDEKPQMPNIMINIGDGSVGASPFVNANAPGMRDHIDKNKVPSLLPNAKPQQTQQKKKS